MALKTLDSVDLSGKRVFIRVDFNCPIENGAVSDDTRIRESLPTIRRAITAGARVILASHLGRPKGQVNPKYSLKPVGSRLAELIGQEITFPDDCVGDGVKKLVAELRPGKVLLLENLRFHKEEEANDEGFAKRLAELADVYVNDAFGTCHRAHASTAGMVPFVREKAAGLLIEKEIQHLGPLLADPGRPYVAVLGGAKVSDKIAVLENLIERVDALLVGGAMAFTFLLAEGRPVGSSLVEPDRVDQARRLMERAKARKVRLLLPDDVVAAPAIDKPEAAVTMRVDDLTPGTAGFDIGPNAAERFAGEIIAAKTVFWNGPMGVFETPAFAAGTLRVAKAVAECAGHTVVGGGDSVAALHDAGLADKVKHVSTGGGASLEFVQGLTLPGIAALEA